MNDTYSPPDFGIDLSVEEALAPYKDFLTSTTALIRTSDRISFKRCRRRWGWSSHLKQNLGPKESQNPLWFGTGIHFALEDFHGYNVYGSPSEAFKAYCEATYRQRNTIAIPAVFPELKELGVGMMDYYELWLRDRPPLKTFWYNNRPQVEVRALIEVPWNPQDYYPDSPYDRVVYSVTIDRVVEDEDGLLWPGDYKTAKQIQTMHFSTDPQIGAYYWAASHIYPDRQVGGFFYQQHRKDLPQDPRFTASGRMSIDKRMLTTHRAYRAALVNVFGPTSDRWPQENLRFLNELASQETQDSDRFIRRDRIYRNEYSAESEGAKILLELEDMLNPNLPLYPNPTRDCAFLCPFLHACTSIDDGSDYMYELELQHAPRPTPQDSWRQFLPQPTPTPTPSPPVLEIVA
jgi:PD-(D/E)XK nuclease superfamily